MTCPITLSLFDNNGIIIHTSSDLANIPHVLNQIKNMFNTAQTVDENIHLCIKSKCGIFTRIHMFFHKNKAWFDIKYYMSINLERYYQQFPHPQKNADVLEAIKQYDIHQMAIHLGISILHPEDKN